ncbi:MAG: hypothetical protein IKX40_06220, partial [Thermoguttaceae bacterium]|nr:hypothetical protein [Thermoguttaceae bacterium]
MKSGTFIPPSDDKVDPPPREPVQPTYIRKSIRDLAPLYLMEKNGELIPALNWTPEELDALIQSVNDNQRQAELPDYICESLTLTGVQKDEAAEMELKMSFTVPQKPLVRIPLQLNGAVLLEAPKCAPGEYLVPQNGGGYVLIIKTSEGNRQEAVGSSESEQPSDAQQVTEPAPEENPEPSPEPTSEPAAEQPSEPTSEEEQGANNENPQPSNMTSESDSSSGVSQKHEITLKILVPLQKNQSMYTLNMKLPKALFSQITLETPFPSVEMRVSPHASAQPTEALDGGKRTKISAYSLGSEFQMQWQVSESQESNSRIMESFADIHVDIRPGEIFYTANMRLQFANQSPSDFILNLPQSAEILPSLNNEYTFERLGDSENSSSDLNAVKIHLNNAYQNSVKLTFQARVPIDQTTSLRWQDLMGFGIRGSVRQNGCVGVNVDKSYQVIWNPGRNVSRVDELPESYEGEYQYAFLFSEQPCSLMARIVAGRTRINVQPQYKVFIGEEEMRL